MNLVDQACSAYAASVAETEQRAREAAERVKRDRAYQLALLLRKRLDIKVEVTDCTVDIDGLRFGLNTSTIPPTLMVSRPCSGCGRIPDPALGAPVTDLVSLGSELSLPPGKCSSCRREANAAVAVAQEIPPYPSRNSLSVGVVNGNAGKCGSCRREANAAMAVAQEITAYPSGNSLSVDVVNGTAELQEVIRDAVTAARPEGFDDADIAAFIASVLAEVEHRLERGSLSVGFVNGTLLSACERSGQ